MISHKKGRQVKEITSFSNPLIKNMRALTLKKVRERGGMFLAEGLKLIIDALDHGWRIHTLVFAKSNLCNMLLEKTAARAVAAGGFVIATSEKIMATITHRDNPQTIVGVFEQRWHELEKTIFDENSLFLGLDRIRDPGNLGTIIRTADATGISGIILIGETATPFSSKAVRATMGSIFTVPLYRISEKRFLDWRRKFPGFVIGTHLEGKLDYRSVNYTKEPILLLMGNEQKGLLESLTCCCNKLVQIPQKGRADSLNLAVATGIMLYEIGYKTFRFYKKSP
ncbi:MAG: TrmH family [Candidatus Tokpelaia sp. JSC188]|nr:MAG: TrmH family [Candidatus Tokpelaia sp. JSC188]